MDAVFYWIGATIAVILLVVGLYNVATNWIRWPDITFPAAASSIPAGYKAVPQTAYCTSKGKRSVIRLSDGDRGCI